jgi:uncharacterized protein
VTNAATAGTSVATDRDAFEAELQSFVGKPYGKPAQARDPINLPMIRHLTDALGDRNPVYTDEAFAASSIFGGIIAPPTSLQVWTMAGLARHATTPDPEDPQVRLMTLFDEAGYVGVVATNCEQTYHRPLHLGDVLTSESSVESISGLKQTALGDGYFLTTLQAYRDQSGEVVGEMRFRILKFRPRARGDGGAATIDGSEKDPGEGAALPPPPRDSAFFWEGVEARELRIQRCTGCGELRHPPRPMCPQCHSLDYDHVVSSGRGEVYSYVVHHHPPVPGQDHPFVVALVQLEEGTRILGNLLDAAPEDVHVGTPVQVDFVARSDGRLLPQWRPRDAGTNADGGGG